MLLEYTRRHSRIDPQQLADESLVHPINPVDLKHQWIKLLEKAQHGIMQFPADELGCICLTDKGETIRAPSSADMQVALAHFGSVGGSWPRIV